MEKRRASKSNASKEIEKEFLKQLKTIEKNERSQKRKTIPEKQQPKNRVNVERGRTNRGKEKSSGIPKRNKSLSKVPKPIQKQSKSFKGDKGAGRVTKNKKLPWSGSVEIKPRKRGEQNIEFSFKGVRSIKKKVDLVNSSTSIQTEIKKQLKRKNGKPPKGIIIIVRDKKGNEAAHVSIPSFVVNEENVKKELEKFTKDLKEDYSQRQQDLADGEPTDTEGYENYNPDNIESIEIKFIY